ncbi:hypothetical protein ACFL09_06590 [Planctomycetota bacterium]
MAKKRKEDAARSRPLSLDFLRQLGALKDFTPPTGAFDPKGAWTNTYHLWLVQGNFGGAALTIRREPKGDRVRLHVSFDVAEWSGYVRRTKAVLGCKADTLCTPVSWTLESQAHDVSDKPIAGTKLAERGTVGDGILEVRFGSQARKEKVAAPVTSQWSLCDAVQRFPGEGTKPLAFTMLEEMDLVKPDQRLEFREEKDFKVGDTTLHLRGYQQIGWGILPWQYWVDDQRRLLFAFSGVRAYIYNTNATAWLKKKLDGARWRTRRIRQGKK